MKMSKLIMVMVLMVVMTGCATTMTGVIAEDGSSLKTRRIAVGGAKINGSEQASRYYYTDGAWEMSTGDNTAETNSSLADVIELLQLINSGGVN